MHAVIIGLGPAGIIAARALSAAGVDVTALQPSAQMPARAPLAAPRPTVRRAPGDVAALAAHPQAGADGIGGSKRLAAAQSYRLDPGAFAMRSAAGACRIAIHDALADWPLTANALDPYHARIEQLMGVAARADTTWTTLMRAAGERLGHHPISAPAAADRDASPLLPRSVRVIDATATRIATDGSGAASAVTAVSADGQARTFRGDVVIVAASPIPSVRLLLLSGIDADGLVGTGFLAHNSLTVSGWFPGTDLARDEAGPASAIAISEFESGRRAADDLGFLGGSILQAAGTGPRGDAWRSSVADGLPPDLGGTDPTAWIRAHEREIGTVWAQPDQLPHPDNRIDLDPDHVDDIGLPVARLTFDLHDDDLLRATYLRARMGEWLTEAGATRIWGSPPTPQPLGTHLYGGIPMGADPSTSVVDAFGFAHRTPGLVVIGSSTFPTSGGRGPVQTIEALALRTAERIATEVR